MLQLFSVSCSSDEPDKTDNRETIALSQIEVEQINAYNELAFNLLSFYNDKNIKNGENNTNLIIAPYSMSLSLSMAANYLTGDDLKRIEKILRYKSLTDINNLNKKILNFLPKSDTAVTLAIANSVWNNPVSKYSTDELKSVIKEFYDAPVFDVNIGTYAGMTELNSWCSKATQGLIPNFLDEPVDCELMFINSNYFHGEWTNKCDKSKTAPHPIKDANGTNKVVSTMDMELYTKVAFSSNFNMVSLPFGNKNFYINLILPNEEISVGEIIESLDEIKWNELIANSKDAQIDIRIPKLKISYKANFADYINNVKIDNTTAKSSDLTTIFANQITNIEINEDDMSSSAVSRVNMPLQFNFNKPFIFLITENQTGAIMFAGIIKNP